MDGRDQGRQFVGCECGEHGQIRLWSKSVAVTQLVEGHVDSRIANQIQVAVDSASAHTQFSGKVARIQAAARLKLGEDLEDASMSSNS